MLSREILISGKGSHYVTPASLPVSARRLLLAISGMATGFRKNGMLCANPLGLNIAVPNTRMIFL
jgi:hypothetical protein